MPLIGATKERILRKLAEEGIHGYALSRELGISLSSVYEHLEDLQKEGLAAGTQSGRRRVWRLTAQGRALLEILGPEG